MEIKETFARKKVSKGTKELPWLSLENEELKETVKLAIIGLTEVRFCYSRTLNS